MDDKPRLSAGKSSSKDLLSVTGDGSSRSVVESLFKSQPQAPSSDAPKTFMVSRSPLLDQLQSFLPAIQRANQQLLEQSPEDLGALDIENIDDDDKVVEMNIVLGEMDSEDEPDNGETDEHLDENDSEDDGPMFGPVTSENLRIPSAARSGRKRGKDLIQEMSDTSEDSEEGDRSDGEMTVASSSSAER